jgi:hypothetical protein
MTELLNNMHYGSRNKKISLNSNIGAAGGRRGVFRNKPHINHTFASARESSTHCASSIAMGRRYPAILFFAFNFPALP